MVDLFSSAEVLATAVARKRISPTEVVEQALARITREQPRLNAFITVMDEPARAAARALERRLARRQPVGPLAGVPVAVKDLLLTKDAPTTSGSRIHGDGLPPQDDAEVVRQLRRAGAIIIGKANLHEIALGVTNINEHFGPARNPWNRDHVSGGSSGGSAVAVAAGLTPLGIGTDTRGSIRIPAACCGITGFKPTRGLLSLKGVLPLAPTLDHVGPMARSVRDLVLMMANMRTGSAWATSLRQTLSGRVRGLTIGVSEYHLQNADTAIVRMMDRAIEVLTPLVRNVRRLSLAELMGVQGASGVVAGSEAVHIHHEYLQSRPGGYGPVVRERLEGGYKNSALEYLAALDVRQRAIATFDAAFEGVDLVIAPSLLALPPRIDNPVARVNGSEMNVIEAFTWCNAPQNMTGLPALSLPAGTVKGLPVGLQVVGPRDGDLRVLSLGAAWQRATDWHTMTPNG